MEQPTKGQLEYAKILLREQLGLIVGRLEKLLTFRLALAYGLIQITGRPVKFYFEEREKQC